MGHQFTKLGSVGGAGKSATPDGFNSGNSVAATGNYRGGVGEHKDLRTSNAAGSGPKAAKSASGYNQGDTFAASKGNGQGGHPIPNVQHKDLRGGNTPSGSGYKQGSTVTANKK